MGGISFLDWEGTDPVSTAREAAENFTAARTELENNGIRAFLFNASSPEEFDERVSIRGVSTALDSVAEKYLNPSEGHAKLTAALRREFVAETETVHLKAKGDEPARDVKLEKGKLTREVGGKPSEHMDKVNELAEKGDKAALFFKNVLHHSSRGAFAVCPTCEGRGSHVNPGIDAEGLSAEDFAEDPDFEESYFRGDYDVPCAECGGARVVPQCAAEGCKEPALSHESGGWTDRRDRVDPDHYSTCGEHLSGDELEDVKSEQETNDMMRGERMMGA